MKQQVLEWFTFSEKEPEIRKQVLFYTTNFPYSYGTTLTHIATRAQCSTLCMIFPWLDDSEEVQPLPTDMWAYFEQPK